MTKHEFIQELRKALSGMVGHSVINENVTYYEDYIDMEVRKGRSEEEVLSGLGDPRLIAKTIIETTKAATRDMEETGENGQAGKTGGRHRVFHVPGWLFILLFFLVLFLLFQMVGMVLSFLLPILLPVILIWYAIRWWRSRR